MNIVSRFRCGASVHGAYVTLEPIGPPDGATGVIVGTGRGPCELGKVADPSDFVVGDEYEIVIQRVGVKDAGGQTAASGNDSTATSDRRKGRNGEPVDAVAGSRGGGVGVN